MRKFSLRVLIIIFIVIMSTNDALAHISLTLDKSEIRLKEGESTTLNVTIIPGDVDVSFIWTSSNENVAIVDYGGHVTAINEGTAIISVSNSYGVEATCQVTVVHSSYTIKYLLYFGIIGILVGLFILKSAKKGPRCLF